MNKNNLPHFELSVGELEEEENVYMTSLVANPATDMKIQVFSKQVEQDECVMKFKTMAPTDEYKRIISGVWMMPDTKYYRVVKGFEFTVSFSKDELKKALINYLKNGCADSFDYEHNNNMIEDLVSIEHWIIENKETRSPVLGYSLTDLGYTTQEIPIGTVMKSVYVKDEQFFNDMVLSGNVMGYSIEGLFNLKQIDEQMINTMDQYSNREMFSKLGLDQSNGTVITTDGKLTFNKNKVTLNDNDIMDGEFKTSFGFNIVIKDGTLVDFGFNEVAVESGDSVPTQEVEQPIEAPQVETVNEEKVDVAVETVVEKPNVNDEFIKRLTEVQNKLDEQLSKRDAKIAELEAKLAEETKTKEELIKSKPIAQKSAVKTAPENLNNFIVREKGGQKYYIPKK